MSEQIYAELAGQPVLEATVTIPVRGTWTADVVLAKAVEQTSTDGLLTLTMADVTLKGTVVRGGDFQSSFRARMVGGYAKWRNTLGPKSYQNAAGLRLKPILTDLAREAGERINITDDRVIGTAFVRKTGPATLTLDELYPDWWVDAEGVTQIRPRPTSTVTAEFQVMGKQAENGRLEIDCESPAQFLPGASFAGPTIPLTTANMVVYRLKPDSLMITVYVGQDRLLQPLLQLVKKLLPQLQYAGVNDYIVASMDAAGQTADLQPLARPDLPVLQKVALRTLSTVVTLTQGTKVGVVFRNLDPTMPSIVDYDAPGTGPFAETLWVKTTGELKLGPEPELQAARSGDQTASGGLGTNCAFALLPTGDPVPVPAPMMTNTPYFISFGNALAVPPVLPTFPAQAPLLPVGQMYGIISTGSPYVKE